MQALQPSDDQLAEEHAAAFLLMAALSLAAGSLIYLLTLRLAVPDQVARLAGNSCRPALPLRNLSEAAGRLVAPYHFRIKSRTREGY